MTYLTEAHIADSGTMRYRIAQCAANEMVFPYTTDPDEWMLRWRREWASAPGWDEAWEYALATHPVENGPYDPGSDNAVITDGMILAQVQGMLEAISVAELQPPPEE